MKGKRGQRLDFAVGCVERPLAGRRTDRLRLILDGTAVRVRLDRKATSVSLLVVIGVRENGQKVLLAIKSPKARLTAHKPISSRIKVFLAPIARRRPSRAPGLRFPMHVFALEILRANNPRCALAELLGRQGALSSRQPGGYEGAFKDRMENSCPHNSH